MSPGIFHIRRLYFFPPDDSPDIVQNDSAHLIPAFHREIKTDLSRPKAKDFFRLIPPDKAARNYRLHYNSMHSIF